MPSFFIMGISHHQAPVSVRERFASLDGLEKTLYNEYFAKTSLVESLILSTCNRFEILGVSQDPHKSKEAILESLSDASQLPLNEISPYLHEYADMEAARYLFKVASSLDSLILGEPQILGQVKEAFQKSLDSNRAKFIITKLMHRCFRAAKRVRTETSLAGGAVSVAGAAVSLAKKLEKSDLGDKSVLVLGAGSMASLTLSNLKKRSLAQISLMNRSLDKAENLATQHKLAFRPWEELSDALLETDIIITATAAPKAILTYENMEKAMAVRGKKLTIIDIGVPRNAAHDVKYFDKVILKNIDDLNEVVWENKAARENAALKAEGIIEEEVQKFEEWIKTLAHLPTVLALTRKAERIRRFELKRTFAQNNFNPEQMAAIETMTSALVRRLLHDPLNYIKNGSNDDCQALKADAAKASENKTGQDYLRSIQQLFNLKPETHAHFNSLLK